jgi:hypothetical protein
MEPLEAVISIRSSDSYIGSSFVNKEKKPAERSVRVADMVLLVLYY